VYDAFGSQVELQNGSTNTEFIPRFAAMNGQSQLYAFVPLPGGAKVKYGASSIAGYFVPDWQGSFRISSLSTKAYNYSVAFAPFGERYSVKNGSLYWFAENPDQTVTDEYDADNRKLHSSQGRWISPDPMNGSLSDPQSFNKYAYVGNNPMSFTDPSGLTDCVGGDFSCSVVTVDGEEFDGEFGRYLLGALLGMDAAIVCNNNCSAFSNNYVGSNGMSYSLIAGVNGPVWVNNANGDEMDPEAAAELGLQSDPAGKKDPTDLLGPGEVIIRPKSSPVMIRMRIPFLVSCKPGEKQYATITFDNVKSIANIGTFNVTSGLERAGDPTTMGPSTVAGASPKGTWFQFFYTTTGGLMTWYASGSAENGTPFRAYAREDIQCQ